MVPRNPHRLYARDTQAEGQYDPAMPWFDRVRHVVSAISHVSAAAILDCGSNTGGMGRLIRDSNPEATLYGVDLSFQLLPKALANGYRGVAQAAGEGLPFRSDLFDVVVLSEILEHADDAVAMVREAYRVLRPNGVLYGDVPTWYGKWGYRSLRGHKWHRRCFWRRSLYRLLTDAGFRLEMLQPEPRRPTRHFLLPQWYTFKARKG